MHYGEQRVWGQIIHRSRRFFPLEAAQEIWEEFSPAMSNVFMPESMEVASAITHRVHMLSCMSECGAHVAYLHSH